MNDALRGETLTKPTRTPLTITLIYACCGVLWVIFSDQIPTFFGSTRMPPLYVEVFAGGFYVLITAAILFFLITRSLSAVEQQQAKQQKIMLNLKERTKELNCLFAISSLGEKRSNSLEAILQGAAELIPPAWQYPEIACARIILDGQEFPTNNFQETIWRQACDILVEGEPGGRVEVYYREERPAADEGPFLKEERRLITAIAEQLSKAIDRRRVETALQESEKRFRLLIENSLTGISIVQDNRVVYQNQEQERLLGPLPRPYILGDLANIHPEDLEKVKQLSHGINSGESRTLQAEFRFYPPAKRDIRLELRWVHCRATSIEYRGQNAVLVNMMDITRSRELEDLLRIQDKMASLGRVAAGIAHEIRNPLSGINIYLNTLERIHGREGSQSRVGQIIRQLKSASNKIESVIRRVMDFSKPSEPKFVTININQPIEEAINLTAVTLRKNGIQLEKNLTDNLPLCLADPNLIEEMVLNLINNAAEAMQSMEGDKQLAVSSSGAMDRILIRVSDSGPGVPLESRTKIFDPFFTTKHEGTGIGLSLSHRIVTDHGGSLQVTTSKWGGAEFVVELPVNKRLTE
ncbi:MAG: PAS domain S-box protein [Desulfobacterales bacterium]|nr:MAG: PAS domain S-box protein [Desulfobacterales bacterium]